MVYDVAQRQCLSRLSCLRNVHVVAEGVQVALVEAVAALGVIWRVTPRLLLMGGGVVSDVVSAAPQCSASNYVLGGGDGWLRGRRQVPGWLV